MGRREWERCSVRVQEEKREGLEKLLRQRRERERNFVTTNKVTVIVNLGNLYQTDRVG